MRIVCLANSYRTGGRSLGGIELDNNNSPVFRNNRPKWVRPVCDTENEEVPNNLVSHISLLDIIEFKDINEGGHGHQTENVFFNKSNSIEVLGTFPINQLDSITGNDRFRLIFGNRGAAVPEHKVTDFDYSLKLIELTEFETNERQFEDREYPQIKLSFRYKGNSYNFPITDPDFLHKYGRNNDILENVNKIYVTFSLAAPHSEWSSKLVAGIIISNEQVNNTVEDDLPW